MKMCVNMFKKNIIAMLLCLQGASLVAMKAIEQKKIAPGDWTMFQRALNSEGKIEAGSEFYKTQSSDELHHLIDEVTKVLGNEKAVAAFSKEREKPVSDIERLFQNAIGHAREALESKEQAQFPPLQPIQKSYLHAATATRKPAAVEKKSGELAQSGNHVLHIMLDIPERNNKGQPIDWGKPIQYLTSRMNGAQFEPNVYHHITLARYKSAQPFPEDFLPKVHKVLSHAQEILKTVYPQGVGISFDDYAILLGSHKRNVVAFNVAHSAELEKLKEIISKFISFEDIAGFEFRTFSGERPFHVALGRVSPKSAAAHFEGTIKQLYAPAGARASQGQQFLTNRLSLSFNTKDNPQKIIETYEF
jgi:hypothetical protein